jgi:hypothetical protein
MHGLNLTEFGTVSVRRLAWAIGTNMAEAIDFMALYTPAKNEHGFCMFQMQRQVKMRGVFF